MYDVCKHLVFRWLSLVLARCEQFCFYFRFFLWMSWDAESRENALWGCFGVFFLVFLERVNNKGIVHDSTFILNNEQMEILCDAKIHLLHVYSFGISIWFATHTTSTHVKCKGQSINSELSEWEQVVSCRLHLMLFFCIAWTNISSLVIIEILKWC